MTALAQKLDGSPGADPMIGRIIAKKYKIRRRLGGGAMGVVYEAKQIALDKRVAIKVLNDELQHNRHFVARFQVEAKAASLLDHANSTRVFDFGKDDSGLLYICMELLEGKNLLEVIDSSGPLPANRVVDLVAQTLAALAQAHDHGILHRDLKPENIMVLRSNDDDGESRDVVKVCDFGIAKFDGGDATERRHVDGGDPGESDDLGEQAPSGQWKVGRPLTQVGLIIGTPDYMSPEQARGEIVDVRSEIYSVGVVLYHLLTGRVPFHGGDVLETLTRHMTVDPVPPSQIRANVDPELEAICRIAMSKNPEERYRSARDMRAALRSTAACRRVGGGRAAMFSFVPPVRTLPLNNGRPGGASMPVGMAPVINMASPAPVLSARSRANVPTPTGSPSSRAPALPVASLALQEAPPRRPLAVFLAAAITVVFLGGAVAVGAHPQVATAASQPAPPRDIAVAYAASAAPLTVTAEQAPPAAPSAHLAAAVPVAAPAPSSPAALASSRAPAPAEVVTFDPKKGRVAVVGMDVGSLDRHQVSEVLRQASLEHCYVEALEAHGSAATGSTALTLDVAEGRVASMALGSDFGLKDLRPCLEPQVVGQSVGDDGTASGSAQVTLQFTDL